ncbi:hypothetical protein CHS0354_018036 [Potamilus streckersoni]|uniref:Glypican-6 n=1 Tax=Potamilus streckersoni TaxID=2493646 RepID=A0AAE0RN92_9BIVA|nr:hypothetical protein CHS0354_018036 [Potamilus streckersoni]
MADRHFQNCDRGWFLIVYIFLSFCVMCIAQDLACIEVKIAYVDKGFSESDVPIQAVAGDNLEVCTQSQSCCTRDMESKLQSLSMKEYEQVAEEAFKYIKTTFQSRTKKFDEFFTELLNKAKSDLHEMFVRTYGLLYQQNAEVFDKLFTDLTAYYKGRDSNLVHVLDNFFIDLLQRMFELLNKQYEIDKQYLGCVTKHMDDLKPFGDVPAKLKAQVKRAFIAARTFVQGLAIGRDVLLAMAKIPPTEQCTKGILRMRYCPHCRGLTRTKPCNNYCLNTMKGCLAHHADLNQAWNEYIEALKMVASRLEGPFNIESVVDPIDVKISDAIMNFQESSVTVTKQIFKGCGKPRLHEESGQSGYRKTRNAEADSATTRSTSLDDYTFGKDFMQSNRRQSVVRPTTAAGTSLDRLVRDIKDKVRDAKDFWIQLPYTICNNEEIAAKADQEGDCWNGQDRAKYNHEVQKDGRMYQVNNPEVAVGVSDDQGLVVVQINQLKLITSKLHNAYNGIDVGWIDTPKIYSSGDGDLEQSGNGDDDLETNASGSGSGAGIVPDDEDMKQQKPSKRPQKPVTKDDDFKIDNPKYVTPSISHPDGTKSKNYNSMGICVSSPVFLLVSLFVLIRTVLMAW